VIAALDQAGVPVRVDPQFGFHFGSQRTATPSETAEVWYLSEEGRFGAELRSLPGAREVVAVSPLPPARERELRSLQSEVAAALTRAGREDLVMAIDSPLLAVLVDAANAERPLDGVDLAKIRRVAGLNSRVAASGRCRCVIVAFPARDAPELPYSLG
jgi:hypothetical protein